MTSTELVGPLKVGKVTFTGGPSAMVRMDGRLRFIRTNANAIYTPPANTLDPRYDACTDHHVACDCREAVHAEIAHEYRMEAEYWRTERDALTRKFTEVLAGHPTFADKPCQCTGCQLARLIPLDPEEF